jgi:8-oxo-dGTP diphosphatase
MADINKSALLLLNEDETRFLVTRKSKESVTTQWIMPGGGIEPGDTPEDALVREIKEEVACDLDGSTLQFIGEYEAPAAGQTEKRVNIRLYAGRVSGRPAASSEIEALGWIDREDRENLEVSEIIREHIIPDLMKRKILK